MRPSVLIDANLLVLLVVGKASRDYISRHKKLTEFTPKDYDTLVEFISAAPAVLFTPNTLTETSNLASHISEPARSKILQVLRRVIAATREKYVPSQSASERKEFLWLGLTDSALIEASSVETQLLTTDLRLYRATLAAGKSALNFNHLRDL